MTREDRSDRESESAFHPGGRPPTATDYVSDVLRRSILNGELEGGARLSLTDLASTLHVSTTPVREALRELSFEGLVRIDNYRGGTVAAVSRQDVEEVVRIRQVLEPLAIREAVPEMTERILEEAEDILETMNGIDTWDRWVEGNRSFHAKLYEATPSRRLVALISSLQDTTVVYMSARVGKSQLLKDQATRDHRAMVEAARTGDSEGFVELILRHLTIPLEDPE